MKSINQFSRPYFKLLALALALSATVNTAWASAGRFQFIHGDIRIVGIDGRERAAQKGVEINEGESIISAKSASAQLLMADGGVIAIRPETHMRIDEYKFNGQEDGSERSFFSLVKGGFRSITGLIGKLHKGNYGIKTPSATIGIRGTDSETVHVLAGAGLPPDVQPGTYNKVNTGTTVVNGTAVGPNQVAYTSSLNMPATILPKMPSIFEPPKATQTPTRDNQKQDKKAENKKEDAAKNGKPEGSQPAKNQTSGEKTGADNQAKPASASTPDNSTSPPQSTDGTPPPPASGTAPPPPGGVITGANIALPPPPPPTTALVGTPGPTGGLTSGANTILAPIGSGGVGGDISSRTECNQAGTTCINGLVAGNGAMVVEGPNQTILFDATTKQPILVAEQDPNGGMKYTSGTAQFIEAGNATVGGAKVVWGRYVGADQFVDKSTTRDPITMNLMFTDQAMNYIQASNYFTGPNLTANFVLSAPIGGNVIDERGAVYALNSGGTLAVDMGATPQITLNVATNTVGSRNWNLTYEGSLQQFYKGNCPSGPCGLPLLNSSTLNGSATAWLRGEASGLFIGPAAAGALTSYSATTTSGASILGTTLFIRQ